MRSKIICLTGLSGCGKNYVADIICKFIPDSVVLNVGDIVEEYIKVYGGSALDLKNKDTLLELLIQKIDSLQTYSFIIITGIRELYLIKWMRDHYSSFSIAVEARESIRMERLEKRKLTIEQIDRKTREEIAIGVIEAMKECDITIENN